MRRSATWGSLLVLLGLLFLLDNLGMLPVRAWAIFWPLLLIVLGTWTLVGVFRRNTMPETTTAEIPLQGASSARVRIQHGAGILRVNGGAAPNILASGTFAGRCRQASRSDGQVLELTLSPEIEVLPFPTHWGRGGAYDWSLALSDAVPIDLTIETGAGESRLDLSSLPLRSLTLKTGASETSLTLPARPVGTCPVRIAGGVASVAVAVPDGTEAFLSSEGGLTDVQVDRARFLPVPGGYQTSGYAGASERLEIRVSMGLGSFRLS